MYVCAATHHVIHADCPSQKKVLIALQVPSRYPTQTHNCVYTSTGIVFYLYLSIIRTAVARSDVPIHRFPVGHIAGFLVWGLGCCHTILRSVFLFSTYK